MSGALARKDDSRGKPAARAGPEVPLARSSRSPVRLVWSSDDSNAPESLEPGAPPHLVAFHRGYMLGAAGQFENAITEFRRAIRLKPDYAEAHHNLGVMLGEAEHNLEAIDAFVEAIRLKPGYAGAHRDLGVMLADSNQLLPAIASFHEALKLKPDDAQTYYDLGSTFEELGDWRSATDAFREAIRLSPNYMFSSNAYRSLGVALRRSNQLSDAIDAFRSGIALYADYAPPHFYLGATLYEVGDIVGGIEAASKAVQIRPDYAAAHFYLGVMFQEIGQPRVAIDEYLAALRYARNDEYRTEATTAIKEILNKLNTNTVSESDKADYNREGMDTATFTYEDAEREVARRRGFASVADMDAALRLAAANSTLGRQIKKFREAFESLAIPKDGFDLKGARAAAKFVSTYQRIRTNPATAGVAPDLLTDDVAARVNEIERARAAFYRAGKHRLAA